MEESCRSSSQGFNEVEGMIREPKKFKKSHLFFPFVILINKHILISSDLRVA